MKNIVFISKDALRKGALPMYGNTDWKTPNIDALAQKGTVFHRHYTAGASTAMAFTSMAIQKYCYETGRKLYDGKEASENGNTIFDVLHERGYDVHIAWDDSYTSFAETHFRCEGLHTTVHSLNRIIPQHEPHVTGQFDDLTFKDDETQKGLQLIEELFASLDHGEKPLFLWLHLPHVFSGRNAYDSDIDVFDTIIGIARAHFDDDCIYVSADHGQMNGHKGKYSYGFDVEEAAINIPLITPKFNGMDRVDFPTTTTQMLELFGVESFEKRDYVLCETAYYVQPKRKVAIVHGNFKLCYDKHSRQFELYDLDYDPAEEHNLFYPEFYDTDRKCWYSLNQRFYYPGWQTAMEEKEYLQNIFRELWQTGTFFEELQQKVLFQLKLIYSRLRQSKAKNRIVNIGK